MLCRSPDNTIDCAHFQNKPGVTSISYLRCKGGGQVNFLFLKCLISFQWANLSHNGACKTARKHFAIKQFQLKWRKTCRLEHRNDVFLFWKQHKEFLKVFPLKRKNKIQGRKWQKSRWFIFPSLRISFLQLARRKGIGTVSHYWPPTCIPQWELSLWKTMIVYYHKSFYGCWKEEE